MLVVIAAVCGEIAGGVNSYANTVINDNNIAFLAREWTSMRRFISCPKDVQLKVYLLLIIICFWICERNLDNSNYETVLSKDRIKESW